MPCPPEWIETFANSIAACLEPIEPMPPLGCHYHRSEQGWEISLFPSVTEVVGGSEDGLQISPRYQVDVLAATNQFTEVHALTWQTKSVGDHDQLGCHLSIDGIFLDQPVSVRILRTAPSCFEPGRKAMVNEGEWIETW